MLHYPVMIGIVPIVTGKGICTNARALGLTLAGPQARTPTMALSVALAHALLRPLTGTLALAHAVPVTGDPLRGWWNPGTSLSLVVRDQRMWVGRIEGIVVPIGVGIQGIRPFKELPEVRPSIIVGVVSVVQGVCRVQSVQHLPAVPAAPVVRVGVQGIGASPKLVQVS